MRKAILSSRVICIREGAKGLFSILLERQK